MSHGMFKLCARLSLLHALPALAKALQPEELSVLDQGAECDASTDGECAVSFRQLRASNLKMKAALDHGQESFETVTHQYLGILNLDGYIYPTQPGDVNDLRTWCTVNPEDVDKLDYNCAQPAKEGEFPVEYAVLKGLGGGDFTFYISTMAEKTSYDQKLVPTLKRALSYLLGQPHIAAFTCNVGFCAELQPLVQQVIHDLCGEDPNARVKPTLLGSPALLPAFGSVSKSPKLLLNPKTEKIIVLTSYYPGLNLANLQTILDASGKRIQLGDNVTTKHVSAIIREHFGMECAEEDWKACMHMLSLLYLMHSSSLHDFMIMAKNVLVIGWNQQEGYKPVDEGGAFHNVRLTLDTYKPRLKNAFDYLASKGFTVKGIIMESTEMPAHANQIRMDFNVPVWDISTVGQCLMAAAPTYAKAHPAGAHAHPFVDLFDNAAFIKCLEDRFTPAFIDSKFGTQTDGSLKFYEGLSQHEVDSLTCNGGRPQGKAPIGRLMKNYDIGYPVKKGSLNPVCLQTKLCQCEGVPANGKACPGLCPGSGNCGGGPYGPQLNPRVIGSGYPCGVDGTLCSSLADVPPVNKDLSAFPQNSYACAPPAPAQGFTFGDFKD